MPHSVPPRTVLPESLSPWLATTDPALQETSNTHSMSVSVSCGGHWLLPGPVHTRLGWCLTFLWKGGLILNAAVTILPSSCDFSWLSKIFGWVATFYGCSAAGCDFIAYSWVHILILHHLQSEKRELKFPFQKILKLSQYVQCLPLKSLQMPLCSYLWWQSYFEKREYTDLLWVIGSWLWTDNKLQRWKYIEGTLARDSNENSMKDNFGCISQRSTGTNHIADYYLSRPKNHHIWISVNKIESHFASCPLALN